jgi:hypothetical protein
MEAEKKMDLLKYRGYNKYPSKTASAMTAGTVSPSYLLVPSTSNRVCYIVESCYRPQNYILCINYFPLKALHV